MIIWSSSSNPGYISRENEKKKLIWKDICTPNVDSSIIHNSHLRSNLSHLRRICHSQKQSKCSSKDKWTNKLSIHMSKLFIQINVYHEQTNKLSHTQTHTQMAYYSAIKRLTICNNTDELEEYYERWHVWEKTNTVRVVFTYMWNLKNKTN